ncbi:Far3p NDAI_0A08700 [Naumovozyma dairenensis CBS 421]|uniref:Uncharacterized protein n=1 Tax=Naumovozyma dairenensis (strain ATCC 10597 / BCRC 20456 / CBS 421 / NBRC 0211 / NRRL Y-12639) TaxID=1071378 RepID=G0W5D5_NAUDC|nr:hypothetical protein NDAI_0A08700 [Naumovozyma dairenensis CBS 421]CCD23023.1 hypothetical protein NDAI_0A08700 [Naumovozyma dairenensis CBS 421]
MMDSNSVNDNFDYLLQLTKVLTSECRSSRAATDRIESLLKRVATQSNIPYDTLSKATGKRNNSEDNTTTTDVLNEKEQLILENYKLIYMIEQEEYLKKKLWELIKNINDHILSVKNFIIQQKLDKIEDFDNFMFENFDSLEINFFNNIQILENSNGITKGKIALIVNEFKENYKEIDWNLIPKDSKYYANLHWKISQFESMYNEKLT